MKVQDKFKPGPSDFGDTELTLIDYWCLSGEKGDLCLGCQIVFGPPGPVGKPGEPGEKGVTGMNPTYLLCPLNAKNQSINQFIDS